jgi:hypothetical protein
MVWLIASPESPLPYLEQAHELAMGEDVERTGRGVRPALNSERLKSYLEFMEKRLVPEHIDLAFEFMMKTLTSPGALSLKGQAKRLVQGHLRFLAGKMVRYGNAELRRQLMDAVRSLDVHFGKGIATAACVQDYRGMAGLLGELLSDDRVHGDVKQTINTYRYHHERTTGSGGWPELYRELVAHAS